MTMIQISNLNTSETDSFLTDLQDDDSTQVLGGTGYGYNGGKGGEGYGRGEGGKGDDDGKGGKGYGRGKGGEGYGRGHGGRGGYGCH
jgi:hypothetical protein